MSLPPEKTPSPDGFKHLGRNNTKFTEDQTK